MRIRELFKQIAINLAPPPGLMEKHGFNLILLGSCFFIGICWFAYDRITVDRDHHWLRREDALPGCWVTDQFDHRVDRGVLLVCDSVVVQFGSELLPLSRALAKSNSDDWYWSAPPDHSLISLKVPYSVSKEAGSDTLIVQRAGRSYSFLLDHSWDRP